MNFTSWMFIFVFLCPFLIFSRINFIHIPKTGGTSINSLLENKFSLKEIYPHRKFKGGVYGNIFARSEYTDKLPFFKHEFVSGHFPMWFIEEKNLLNDLSFTFTVLRDPVERVLSDFRYRKILSSPNKVNWKKERSNVMCYMLASDPTLEGVSLLDNAIENLEKLDHVIFFDQFDRGLKDLLKLIGVDPMNFRIEKFNSTKHKKVNLELEREIRERNKLDILLYDYAREKIKNKKIPFEQKYNDYDLLSRPVESKVYTFDMPFRGKNWFYRENIGTGDPVYRWIMGKRASVFFNLVSGNNYMLTFYIYKLKECIKPLIEIKGTTLYPRQVPGNTHYGFNMYEVLIPKNLITKDETEIFFLGSNSFVHKDVYAFSNDPRNVSLAFNRIELRIN